LQVLVISSLQTFPSIVAATLDVCPQTPALISDFAIIPPILSRAPSRGLDGLSHGFL
jgi:hypothetical protein